MTYIKSKKWFLASAQISYKCTWIFILKYKLSIQFFWIALDKILFPRLYNFGLTNQVFEGFLLPFFGTIKAFTNTFSIKHIVN